MDKDPDQTAQFARLEAAISRDMERRRKNRIVYWVILGAMAVVSVVIVLVGSSQSDIVASALITDAGFHREVADVVKSNDEVIGSIAQSHQVQAAAREQALKAVESENFTASLAASDAFSRRIENSAQQAAMRFAEQPAFQSAVENAFVGMSQTYLAGIERNQTGLNEIRERIEELSGGGDSRRIRAIEHAQVELASLIQASRSEVTRLSREIDNLVKQVETLQELVSPVRGATPDSAMPYQVTAQGTQSRSYLLKERATTKLPDLGLSVLLGSIAEGVVSSIVFSDSGGPLDDGVKGPVQLGDTFSIPLREGGKLEATLSYTQPRFLVGDYVGLEITVYDYTTSSMKVRPEQEPQ